MADKFPLQMAPKPAALRSDRRQRTGQHIVRAPLVYQRRHGAAFAEDEEEFLFRKQLFCVVPAPRCTYLAPCRGEIQFFKFLARGRRRFYYIRAVGALLRKEDITAVALAHPRKELLLVLRKVDDRRFYRGIFKPVPQKRMLPQRRGRGSHRVYRKNRAAHAALARDAVYLRKDTIEHFLFFFLVQRGTARRKRDSRSAHGTLRFARGSPLEYERHHGDKRAVFLQTEGKILGTLRKAPPQPQTGGGMPRPGVRRAVAKRVPRFRSYLCKGSNVHD